MGYTRHRGGGVMSEYDEALNRDLLFLMIERKPSNLKRLLKRWFSCLRLSG